MGRMLYTYLFIREPRSPLDFCGITHRVPTTQAVLTDDDPGEAVMQLQALLSQYQPSVLPPPLQPLVVCGPFGSGKRGALQQLVARLGQQVQSPKFLTTRPRDAAAAADNGEGCCECQTCPGQLSALCSAVQVTASASNAGKA